jgi:hypothetical protein
MKKNRKPAGNRRGAWLVQEKNFGARSFCIPTQDRLDLEEDLFGIAGRMRIKTGFSPEEITNYQRTFEEKTGIVRASFQVNGKEVRILTFASKKEDLLVYEIETDLNELNLQITFEPERENTYVNYNLGGLYFETQNRRSLLIGKAELKCDGFPKADESGIWIKNAMRAGFRICVRQEERKKKIQPSVQAMEMQMIMNRYLAGTDEISRDLLLKFQEENQV